MVWTIDASTGFGRFDSLAFMLGDVGDIKGTHFSIKVEAAGYSTTLASIPRQPNGNINFVRILFDDFVHGAKVTLTSNLNDGFGIDDVTVARVAPVPLPGAGLLLMGGLAGFGVFRRRRAAV
ncbi:MAG: VPLPA-CTERM sorting domain-containing protein [Rhodovulum sp.]|nr:VPLPA-CTERM sorting domain-containing protein [Rhodovulum sp.]